MKIISPIIILFGFVNLPLFCKYKKVFKILNLPSKPQQLSTYALTLFNYKTEVNGQKVLVGEYSIFFFFPLGIVL